MTAQELAQRLDGRTYRNEITKEEEKLAKQHGLVVVFGASDDLMEFRGAIHDEIGAYDGGEAYITDKGYLVEPEADDRDVFEKYGFPLPKVHCIEAKWEPIIPQGASWLITSHIPHSAFDIFEEGDLYCRGIVFSIDALKRNATS
jgi:hypothetical protein